MKRIIWLTDTHLTFSFLWKKYSLINHIKNLEADALFMSGDISNGLFIDYVLYYIATHVDIPIYFVLGNHDYYFKGISDVHNDIRHLVKKHSNLHWLTESEPISLKDDICVIGTEGWYDCHQGNSDYIKFTFDAWLIEEFRKIKLSEKIDLSKKMAKESADSISKKLISALNSGYKQIYLITHVPPFEEATRGEGTVFEKFLLPYNTNVTLGNKLKEIMSNFPDRKLNVICGHIHAREVINFKNIECRVNAANYFSVGFSNRELIVI